MDINFFYYLSHFFNFKFTQKKNRYIYELVLCDRKCRACSEHNQTNSFLMELFDYNTVKSQISLYTHSNKLLCHFGNNNGKRKDQAKGTSRHVLFTV